MDFDTSSELLTPSVSFSTNVSSSTADIFSLLLTQLHQCHTQRITELEQKISHYVKKLQKLLVLSKEQKEAAARYRKTCQDLKKENHALRKALKEENRKHHHKTDKSELSDELHLPSENVKKDGRKSPTKYSNKQEDLVNPDEPVSSKIPPVSSKLSRLKKKNRKVRYKEVSNPPSDEVRSALKSPCKEGGELLFVPETIDPDLDLIDRIDNESVSSSQNLSEAYSTMRTEKEKLVRENEDGDADVQRSRRGEEEDEDGRARVRDEEDTAASSYCDMEETHLPSLESRRLEQNLNDIKASEHEPSRSDVKPKDASTPVDKVNKLLSFPESPSVNVDGITMSPLITDERSFDKYDEKSLQDTGLENEKLVDNSHTQMSPTFAGGCGLLTHSPSVTERSPLPSLPQDWNIKDKSVSRTFDGTGESEASFLLLQPNTSPFQKVLNSSERRKCPSKAIILSRTLKRRVSPERRLSKVRKVSFEPVSHTKKLCIVRQVTSHPNEQILEEMKGLKQSTLSQHLKPIADFKHKVPLSSDIKGNGFKIPSAPVTVKQYGSDVETGRNGKFASTNVSISLNGSMGDIVESDNYDGEVVPLEYVPSQIRKDAKESGSFGEDVDNVNENSKKKTKEVCSEERCSPVANTSDALFDDISVCEDDDFNHGSFREEELNERQLLALKYDKVPKKDERPQYKHKEVVRKHNEREQLKGFDCKQCAEFYNGMGLTDSQKQDRMKLCSRHRGRYTPPSTPEHYWSIDFPDTPTCIKRGYIQEDKDSKVDAEVMPRRRNKLKQLFPGPQKEK